MLDFGPSGIVTRNRRKWFPWILHAGIESINRKAVLAQVPQVLWHTKATVVAWQAGWATADWGCLLSYSPLQPYFISGIVWNWNPLPKNVQKGCELISQNGRLHNAWLEVAGQILRPGTVYSQSVGTVLLIIPPAQQGCTSLSSANRMVTLLGPPKMWCTNIKEPHQQSALPNNLVGLWPRQKHLQNTSSILF